MKIKLKLFAVTILISIFAMSLLTSCNADSNDNEENAEDVSVYSNFDVLKGSAYYLFLMPKGATEYLGNKVLYSFMPDDYIDVEMNKRQGSRWLYDWNQINIAGTYTGVDAFGQNDGLTSVFTGEDRGWAYFGLSCAVNDENNVSGLYAAEDLKAANSIADAVKDGDWYFAISFINTNDQEITIATTLTGSNVNNEEAGSSTKSFTIPATSKFVNYEIPLKDLEGLQFGEFSTNGFNIFSFGIEPYVSNVDVNIGYAFIYKK